MKWSEFLKDQVWMGHFDLVWNLQNYPLTWVREQIFVFRRYSCLDQMSIHLRSTRARCGLVDLSLLLWGTADSFCTFYQIGCCDERSPRGNQRYCLWIFVPHSLCFPQPDPWLGYAGGSQWEKYRSSSSDSCPEDHGQALSAHLHRYPWVW